MVTVEGGPGERRRAIGYGGDKDTFTWARFLSLEDCYNPSPGQLNPWSLKRWYQWGCRKFHLHNPFGKVAQGAAQELVYEVDQFLNARSGLSIGGAVQSTPMPWLTNDFVAVFKALTSGQRGNLDQATWDSWTKGADAWFDPTQPIDVIVYVGGMADPGADVAYQAYVARWNSIFSSGQTAGVRRLKDSVQPLIDAGCRIGFDAAVASPGSVAGQRIPLSVQSLNLQKGWWNFWTWLGNTIGKSRMYVESHPFKKAGAPCSYLGYNVIADDDWSATPVVPPGPDSPHMTSEMGEVEFWRAIWQNTPTSTPLISYMEGPEQVKGRYWFLVDSPYVLTNKISGEQRLQPADCCQPGHNYYYHTLYGGVVAYHLLEPQHTFGESNPSGNRTKAGILVPNSLLQILPEAHPSDPAYSMQFGIRFIDSGRLIEHLATVLDLKQDLQRRLYG